MKTFPLMIFVAGMSAASAMCFADDDFWDIADSYSNYQKDKRTLAYRQGQSATSEQKNYLRAKEVWRAIKKLKPDDRSVRVEKARNRMLGWKADIDYLRAGADCEPKSTAMFDQMLKGMKSLHERANEDLIAGTPRRWGYNNTPYEYYKYEEIRYENNRFIQQFKKRKQPIFQKCSDEKGLPYVTWKMNHIDRQIKKVNKRINNRLNHGQISPALHQMALRELDLLRAARNFNKYEENRGLWTNFDPHTEPSFTSLNQLLALGDGVSSGSFLLEEVVVDQRKIHLAQR